MTEEIHNAYQTLELPNGANLPQVQKARRKMAMVWHPDRFPAGSDLQREAEERTKQINNAYDILKRYLKDGDIPRSRPRPSKQSEKQESEQRTRQPRSRSSKQSRKQESEQRTRQQNTASEDAHSSQTHEEEDLAVKIGAKIGILAAKISGIIRIIFAIISGAIIGYFIGGSIVVLLDWMIEAASGWSFIDRANPWSETFPIKALILLIILTLLSKNDIAEDLDWFGYTFFNACGGTIGGVIGNEMGIARIATFIGMLFGACFWLMVGMSLVERMKQVLK